MKIRPIRNIAKTRREFERDFHILAEHMRSGKLRFVRGVSTEGLEKVRYLPNRRINFLSVNESARSTANSLAYMENLQRF